MKQYLETICIRQGKALRMKFHQARFIKTFAEAAGFEPIIPLTSCLNFLPNHLRYEDRVRCRVVYDRLGQYDITFHPYQLRPIHSLQCVEIPHLDYARKYADRSALDAAFSQRGTADDVLILRNGYLTDTSIANIALFDGKFWRTPAHPLLEGTHRAALLIRRSILPTPIHISELSRYSRIRLFNAMIGWGEIELGIEVVRGPVVNQKTNENLELGATK